LEALVVPGREFELTFWGGPPDRITYRRNHKSLEKAREEAA